MPEGAPLAVGVPQCLDEDVLNLDESESGMIAIEPVFGIEPGVYSVQVVLDLALDGDWVLDLFETLPEFHFPVVLGVGEVGVEELSLDFDPVLVAAEGEESVHECFDGSHVRDGGLFFRVKLGGGIATFKFLTGISFSMCSAMSWIVELAGNWMWIGQKVMFLESTRNSFSSIVQEFRSQSSPRSRSTLFSYEFPKAILLHSDCPFQQTRPTLAAALFI